MNAAALVRRLERLGVRLSAQDDRLIVDAPAGVLTDDLRTQLRACKSEVLCIVRKRSRLDEVAAALLPSIRLTVRETGDTKRDFDLLGRIREIVQAFQPGGNHIYLTVVTTDHRRIVVEWRGLAERELRLQIARTLARAAKSREGAKRRNDGLA